MALRRERGRWAPQDRAASVWHYLTFDVPPGCPGLSLDELAALAAGNGLDYLAVTDHNTVSHHRFLPAASARYGIELLPGQEVTTSDGHANAFGDIGWIDFREPADSWVSEVARRGG